MGIKFDVIFESWVFRYPRPQESRDIFLASDWLCGSARKETRRENSTGPIPEIAHLRTLETRTFNARYSAVFSVRQNFICRSVSHHSLWRHWRCIDSLDVYRYTRVQAVGNTHARDAWRISNYSIRDISMSFTAAYTFFLPPPLPVERPSLLKFLPAPQPA